MATCWRRSANFGPDETHPETSAATVSQNQVSHHVSVVHQVYSGNNPASPWNAGNAMSNGSTAMVISSLRPAWANPAVVARVNAPSTATEIRPHKGSLASNRTIGATSRGKTVNRVRPGNHQPIMVIATKVAMSICTIISPSASL